MKGKYKKEKLELNTYEDVPYTIVGYTSLPRYFSCSLKAKGLKAILEKCKHDEDIIHINFGNSGKPDFSISQWEESKANTEGTKR